MSVLQEGQAAPTIPFLILSHSWPELSLQWLIWSYEHRLSKMLDSCMPVPAQKDPIRRRGYPEADWSIRSTRGLFAPLWPFKSNKVIYRSRIPIDSRTLPSLLEIVWLRWRICTRQYLQDYPSRSRMPAAPDHLGCYTTRRLWCCSCPHTSERLWCLWVALSSSNHADRAWFHILCCHGL